MMSRPKPHQDFTDKIVQNERGELFIETPDYLWSARLLAWKADQSLPCPMPKGHIMFRGKSIHYKAIKETRHRRCPKCELRIELRPYTEKVICDDCSGIRIKPSKSCL